MKNKYFNVEKDEQGNVTSAYEVFDLSLASVEYNSLITLQGRRLPKVGDMIHVYKNGELKIGKVSKVHTNGIPLKAIIDETKTIELVGSIIQLVNLINRILIALGLKKK